MKYLILFLSLILLGGSPSFAGVASLSWNANTESDLAGYRVHIGEKSGVYTRVIDVALTGNPLSPSVILDDIVISCGENKSSFFALTAYDTTGNESGFSNEVSKLYDPAPCAPTLTQILAAVHEMLERVTIQSKLIFTTTAP